MRDDGFSLTLSNIPCDIFPRLREHEQKQMGTTYNNHHFVKRRVHIYVHENHDIAIAMSSSRADPLLGLNTLLHCLGSFKCLILTTNERAGWSCKIVLQTHTRTQPFIVKDSS